MGDKQPQAGWRVKVGLAIFAASIGWPVLIPILLLLGVSKTVTAAVSGFMLVAAEFMLLGAAAIAGKEGFSLIKDTVFGFLKSHGPPSKVSRTRYTIGLVMFMTPLAFGWVSPYFGRHLPGYEAGRVIYAIVFDVLLFSSLFVLGGGFWDKLQSLFKFNAYTVIPDEPDEKAGSILKANKLG
jgi:hypothetical protein